MDIDVLKAELDAGHPGTGPYSLVDSEAADELNVVNRTRIREAVSGSDILNATDDAEYGLLTADQQMTWLTLCSVVAVDTSSGVAKSLEADLFGGGTTTRSNLAAIRIENISRAVELVLGFVETGHVQEARRI